jgi:hypothetical protein
LIEAIKKDFYYFAINNNELKKGDPTTKVILYKSLGEMFL